MTRTFPVEPKYQLGEYVYYRGWSPKGPGKVCPTCGVTRWIESQKNIQSGIVTRITSELQTRTEEEEDLSFHVVYHYEIDQNSPSMSESEIFGSRHDAEMNK